MLSTPLIRLCSLSQARLVWAKLEHVSPSGSVYDRVASQSVVEGQSAVIGGCGAWCLAMVAAHARRAVEVACVVTPEPPLYEHRVLLERYGVRMVLAAPGELDAVTDREAAWHGARRVPSRPVVSFARTLGEELARDLAAVREGAPEVVVAPDDGHGLVEGLRLAGHRVIAVRAARGARWLAELAPAATGEDQLEIDDATAHHMRRDAALAEGLLLGHVSAATLAAACGLAPARAVAILVDAGDRVFSRDREAAA